MFKKSFNRYNLIIKMKVVGIKVKQKKKNFYFSSRVLSKMLSKSISKKMQEKLNINLKNVFEFQQFFFEYSWFFLISSKVYFLYNFSKIIIRNLFIKHHSLPFEILYKNLLSYNKSLLKLSFNLQDWFVFVI